MDTIIQQFSVTISVLLCLLQKTDLLLGTASLITAINQVWPLPVIHLGAKYTPAVSTWTLGLPVSTWLNKQNLVRVRELWWWVFFFPVGVPKDSRAVWEALSKPFLCPIQGKALPGMSFKGKMSSVDPPIVLFSFHLPLPTFKGPSSLWGNSFHRRKRRKLCPEEPLWILKTWGPQALARCFGRVLMLMQSALEKRNRFQTPKHENWNRFPYWLPSK